MRTQVVGACCAASRVRIRTLRTREVARPRNQSGCSQCATVCRYNTSFRLSPRPRPPARGRPGGAKLILNLTSPTDATDPAARAILVPTRCAPTDRPCPDPPLGRFRGSEITGDHNQGYLRPSSDRFPTPTDPPTPRRNGRPTDPVWRPRGTSSSKSTSLRPASCAACPRENRVSKALLSHEFCVPSFCSTCRSWSPAPPSRAGPMAPCCLRAQHGLC